MKTDELKGKPVLVHPELKDDPAGRQNQIGKIVQLDVMNDDFFVEFKDGHLALYGADALLVLHQSDEIFRAFENEKYDLAEQDLRELCGVALVLQHGFASGPRIAMKLVQKNENIRDLCVESLQQYLDNRPNQEVSR